MSKPPSKRARSFLKYVEDQNHGRIDIGFVDGSTRPVEPLVKAGLLSRDGHFIVITDQGREEIRR